MRRCSTCILTGHAVSISGDGVCSLCTAGNYRISCQGEQALVELLDKHKKLAQERKSKYDCLVPISGGKDSCYVLHQIVTKYKMKPLAFHYYHRFSHEQARCNVDQAVRALGVELVRSEDDCLQADYLRYNIQRLAQLPPRKIGRMSHLLCVGCTEGYARKAEELAIESNIPLIVEGGGTLETDLRFFGKPSEPASSRRAWVVKMACRELSDIVNTRLFYHPLYCKNISRHAASISTFLRHRWRLLSDRLARKRRLVSRASFFEFIEWDYKRIVPILERDIGWSRPQGRTATIRFDCKIHILLDGLRRRYLGFSEKEVVYSNMIRQGMISREEAIEKVGKELSEESQLEVEVLRDVLSRIDLSSRFSNMQRIWA